MCHILTSTSPAFQVKIHETASRTNMLQFNKLFHKVFSGKIFAALSSLKKNTYMPLYTTSDTRPLKNSISLRAAIL